MNKQKRHRRVSRGSARWYASRLEGVRKNRGIKKSKKAKGARTERRTKKTVQRRASKQRVSRALV